MMQFTAATVRRTAEYRRDRGWITFKRPGVQEFLSAAWNLGWEVVLYTDQDHLTAEPVMESLDPGRKYVAFRLYRDSTLYTGGIFKQGTHVRDLSRLNRCEGVRGVGLRMWMGGVGSMGKRAVPCGAHFAHLVLLR